MSTAYKKKYGYSGKCSKSVLKTVKPKGLDRRLDKGFTNIKLQNIRFTILYYTVSIMFTVLRVAQRMLYNLSVLKFQNPLSIASQVLKTTG